MIAYVGHDTGDATDKHGLAITLSNEKSYTDWDTAMASCGSKAAVPGGKWSLLSRDQWDMMVKANGDINGLNAAIVNAGSYAINSRFWSASEYDSDNKWYYDGYDNRWGWMNKTSRLNHARACLAF